MKNFVREVQYKVLSEYQESVDVHPTLVPFLKSLKMGTIFRPITYVNEKTMRECFPGHALTKRNQVNLVHRAIRTGVDIGMLDKISDEKQIKFDEFLKLPSIQNMLKRMRKPKQNHLDAIPLKHGMADGMYAYARTLFDFSLWLDGKSITLTYNKPVKIDDDGDVLSKMVTEPVKIKNIEHLLELYKTCDTKSQIEFQQIFFDYLTDPTHKGKTEGTIESIRSRIKSYFRKNQIDIVIDYEAGNDYKVSVNKDGSKSRLSLAVLKKMLLFGKGSDLEKSVLMSQFHRGLDNSTMVDEFNYEAYPQLVEYFESDDYRNWDLSKCPVPIYLKRMKTQFNHLGILDRDAVWLITKYLPVREKQTGKKIEPGDPLYLNHHKKPITRTWVSNLSRVLAKRSGVLTKIDGFERSVRYGQNSHEKRDLLDSVLDDCGVKRSLIEVTLAHKNSSYRKAHHYFKESSRREFMKASKQLNILTGITNYLDGNDGTERLKDEMELIKTEMNDELNKVKREKLDLQLQQKQMMDNLVDQVMQKAEDQFKQYIADRIKFSIKQSKETIEK